MQRHYAKGALNGALLLSLLALPSCGSDADKKPSSVTASTAQGADGLILISVQGKPAVTEAEFEEFLAQAAQTDQQVKFMLELMPEMTREQLLTMKKRGALISEWAEQTGVRAKADYQKKEQQMIKAIREALDNEAFLEKHKIDVSDKEAREFYEEYKTKDPRLTLSQGGVKAVGVSFDTQSAAQSFAEQAKKSRGKDLDKLAKDQKLSVKDFGVVNQESIVDAKLKNGIIAIKAVPSVEVISDGKRFWVVAALAKEQAQYHPFDQVKEGIKRLLLPKKMEDMLAVELPKLEKEYNLVENQDYLAELRKKREQREQAAQQQMANAGKELAK